MMGRLAERFFGWACLLGAVAFLAQAVVAAMGSTGTRWPFMVSFIEAAVWPGLTYVWQDIAKRRKVEVSLADQRRKAMWS